MILEDDADWDVALKSQLTDFAYAARKIENRFRPADIQLGRNDQTVTPYGSIWDILWLGICANPPGPPDAVTFPGVDEEFHYVYDVQGGTACTYAYGVTQQSARSLLQYLEDPSEPTDIAMSNFCGGPDRHCLVVWPMLISSHKAAGAYSKDSDINHSSSTDTDTTDESQPIRQKGESWKIEHSAILAALEASNSSRTENIPSRLR